MLTAVHGQHLVRLPQVTGVFARRGYNVQSLAVGPSEREGMSRILMVVPGNQAAIDKLLRQLNKLVFVENVSDLTPIPFVNRELMLVKVGGWWAQLGQMCMTSAGQGGGYLRLVGWVAGTECVVTCEQRGGGVQVATGTQAWWSARKGWGWQAGVDELDQG